MTFEGQPILQYLIVSDVFLYIALIVGYLHSRGSSTSMPNSLPDAFTLLESSLWRSYPELAQGLTLREALSKTKSFGIRVDWDQVDLLLTLYESHRYGSAELAKPRLDEIVRLVSAVKSGGRHPKGT